MQFAHRNTFIDYPPQRHFNLFIWMPSSFHSPVPYAEPIRLSTDNHAGQFCLRNSMPQTVLQREFH
ncbi:hypothetical protein, partial [Pantoea septica]|uniref:hypothetical protein n=1 Tax=Pantoea septica TaxID=472695 RepID=UPI0028AC2FC5